MLKKLLGLAFLALGLNTVHAADKLLSHFSILGGGNISNVSQSNVTGIKSSSSRVGYQLGVQYEMNIKDQIAFLQVGLTGVSKGGKFVLGNKGGENYSNTNINPIFLELPIDVAFKIPMMHDKFKGLVGVGGYAAMGLAGKLKTSGNMSSVGFSQSKSIDYSNTPSSGATIQSQSTNLSYINRMDYGINGFIGVEKAKWRVVANYDFGVKKTFKLSTGSSYNRTFSLSVGYKL